MKVWWNDDDWDIGCYDLMFDDREWAYLHYIPVKYRHWSEHEIKRTFKDGVYEAGYCLDGCASRWVLKAKTLYEAKKELEQYFVEYYQDGIESAKGRIKRCEKILKALKRCDNENKSD